MIGDEILREAAALWAAGRGQYRDCKLRVGLLVRDYLRSRPDDGPDSRARGVKEAAAALGVERDYLHRLVQTAATVEALGDPGKMSYTALTWFCVFSKRPARTEEGWGPEKWVVAPEAYPLYARAAAEGWDAARCRREVPARRATKGCLPAGGKVITVGQLAKMAGVAPRTAATWVDNGLVDGYRLPAGGNRPGEGDRRVYAESARAFLHSQGIRIFDGVPSVLCVGRLPHGELPRDYEWRLARCELHGAQELGLRPPTRVLVYLADVGRHEGLRFARFAGSKFGMAAVPCDDECDPGHLLASGFSAVCEPPGHFAAVAGFLSLSEPATLQVV